MYRYNYTHILCVYKVAPSGGCRSCILLSAFSGISSLGIPGPIMPWKCAPASCGVEYLSASVFATLVRQALPVMFKHKYAWQIHHYYVHVLFYVFHVYVYTCTQHWTLRSRMNMFCSTVPIRGPLLSRPNKWPCQQNEFHKCTILETSLWSWKKLFLGRSMRIFPLYGLSLSICTFHQHQSFLRLFGCSPSRSATLALLRSPLGSSCLNIVHNYRGEIMVISSQG